MICMATQQPPTAGSQTREPARSAAARTKSPSKFVQPLRREVALRGHASPHRRDDHLAIIEVIDRGDLQHATRAFSADVEHNIDPLG